MKINILCPKCGGNVPADTERSFIFCNYCGEKIVFGNNQPVQDKSTVENTSIVGDEPATPTSILSDSTNSSDMVCNDANVNNHSIPMWTMVFGILALVIAIVDWFLDPWWVNVIVAVVSIAISIVALVKKFRLKGFAIAAIPIAAIAGIIGVVSVFVGPTAKNGLANKKEANYWDVPIEKTVDDEKKEIGGISFVVPGEFGKAENSSIPGFTICYSYDPADDVGLVIGYINQANVLDSFDSVNDFYFSMADAFSEGTRDVSSHVVRVSGVDCLEWEFTVNGGTADVSNIMLFHKCFCIYNNSTRSVVMIMFNEEADRNNSYLNYFDEIIDSITVTSRTSGTGSGNSSFSSSYSSSSVSPSLKSTLDSLESFADYYVEVMEAYNSGDGDYFDILDKYLECLDKYAEFLEKVEELEQESEDFSPADLAYYIEVMTRIYAKLGIALE